MIEISHIGEPELEFGGGRRHLDIRFGIMDYGPFDTMHTEAPRRIRVGIVGSAETVGGAAGWMDRCRSGLPAKDSRQPNLFPSFPGLGSDSAFRCEFVTSAEFQRTLPERELLRLPIQILWPADSDPVAHHLRFYNSYSQETEEDERSASARRCDAGLEPVHSALLQGERSAVAFGSRSEAPEDIVRWD